MWLAFLYGLVASLFAFVMMYLDTKLLDNPKTKTTYLKGMLMVGSIVSVFYTFLGKKMPDIVKIEPTMFTGPPDF